MPVLSCLEPNYCQVSSWYSGHHPTSAEPNFYKLSECRWLLVSMSLAHFAFQRQSSSQNNCTMICSEVSPSCQYNCTSFSGCPAHTGFQFSLDAGLEILIDQAIVENRGTSLREIVFSTKLKSDLYSVFSTFNSLLVDSELLIIWREKGRTSFDFQPCEELPLFSAGEKWVELEHSNVFENTA